MDTSAEKSEMLARAVELAVKNVAAGGGPFAALVVTADGRVFEGANRVTADNDPTAHAEVTAIRNACRELGTFDLGGATLYTSCEPCPMCLSSALWARIEHVYFAADRHDAAAAGFDDAAFYDYIERHVNSPLMPVERVRIETSLQPFDDWRSLDTKIAY
jgi:guanine deaminase